jgi:hypothetical protein
MGGFSFNILINVISSLIVSSFALFGRSVIKWYAMQKHNEYKEDLFYFIDLTIDKQLRLNELSYFCGRFLKNLVKFLLVLSIYIFALNFPVPLPDLVKFLIYAILYGFLMFLTGALAENADRIYIILTLDIHYFKKRINHYLKKFKDKVDIKESKFLNEYLKLASKKKSIFYFFEKGDKYKDDVEFQTLFDSFHHNQNAKEDD